MPRPSFHVQNRGLVYGTKDEFIALASGFTFCGPVSLHWFTVPPPIVLVASLLLFDEDLLPDEKSAIKPRDTVECR